MDHLDMLMSVLVYLCLKYVIVLYEVYCVVTFVNKWAGTYVKIYLSEQKKKFLVLDCLLLKEQKLF